MNGDRNIVMKVGFCCLVLLATFRPAFSCLRAGPDARAIQWSALIVEAKLTRVEEPVELTRIRHADPGKPALEHVYWYELYTFDIADVLDGRGVRRAQDVKVIRFFGRVVQVDPEGAACSQHLRKEQVGQSFILLLRPERELRVEVAVTPDRVIGDVRTEAVHKLGAYAIVNLVPRAEMDPDQKGALRRLIDEVRGRDRAFSAQKARRAAERVASTAEAPESETEANELLAMGPRAIPEMMRVWGNRRGPRSGRDRLQTLIAELTPPSIPVALEGPMAVEKRQ